MGLASQNDQMVKIAHTQTLVNAGVKFWPNMHQGPKAAKTLVFKKITYFIDLV